MSEVEFLGARLERSIISLVEKTAEEENLDKTKALKELIILGRKQFLIKKHLELYRQGMCSIDKAAEMTGLTVNEIMKEAVKEEIKSTQSIEEYKRGLELLGKQ